MMTRTNGFSEKAQNELKFYVYRLVDLGKQLQREVKMRNKLAKITLAATLGFALTFNFSCSDSGGNSNGNGEPIKKAKITGVSQKGPFVKGSTATLYELDGNFNQTGRSFRDIIADDHGKFEIKGVELISPYAMLEADGFYRNEVTGQISVAPIKLYAIADIREKDNVNVNILTHLEYYRVLNLVENSGKSVAEAKKQAQKEILAVFGISGEFENSEDMSIFGTSEGDAALLAISVLLQGDLSEGEFSQRLTDFAQSIKENGKWENETAKTDMADWSSGMDLASIKNAILDWGLSSDVPDFGKYVSGYWVGNYSLGVCNTETHRNIKKTSNTNSENKNLDYICKNNIWQIAYQKDFDTQEWKCDSSNEGELKSASEQGRDDYYSRLYICRNNWWDYPTNLEIIFDGKMTCGLSDYYADGTSLNYKEDYIVVCKDGVWQILDNPVCERTYPYEGKPDYIIICEE
jgi:hypothetical protein